MKKLLTIIGARPQFIKASALHKRIREEYDGRLRETLLHTGQHYDINMNEVFFRELNLPEPDVNLEIPPGLPSTQTGQMVSGIGNYLKEHSFDWVVTYGDTNSTLAGALAANYHQVPLVHIEAGLRSGNKMMPEEVNRILTDHSSSYLFTPTRSAIQNLINEGFEDKEPVDKPNINNPLIQKCGDVMLETIKDFREKSRPPSAISGLGASDYALVTFHRSELLNDLNKLSNLLSNLTNFANKTGLKLLIPLHPGTKKVLEGHAGFEDFLNHEKVLINPPFSYLENLYAIENATWVLTDSGGLQKESCYHEKKCLILRETSEWQELIDQDLCKVVGKDGRELNQAIQYPPSPNKERFNKIFSQEPPTQIICQTLLRY